MGKEEGFRLFEGITECKVSDELLSQILAKCLCWAWDLGILLLKATPDKSGIREGKKSFTQNWWGMREKS